MKKFTKSILCLTFACIVLALSVFAVGTQEQDTVVSLQIDNPIMQVNGIDAEIDEGKGTKPIILNGRTLVPIRAIIESFGGVVGWDNDTRTVTLTMEDNVISLVIDSTIAHLNNEASVLDVAPVIINGRTMLPIRYVAESFNLGVAWDGETRTVSIVRNSFDDAEYMLIKSMIPSYNGKAYATINNDTPFFKSYEIISGSFEFYANLDELGRCDVAMASIGKDIMPHDERESISSVTPTGWINTTYDILNGSYLYNRCHLIGYQLTGENANKRNLITGTRYMNISGMLPFENLVCEYIERTGNNVIYRSTPVFTGNNLLADGVLLEAYSIEDNGAGINFCVFCYNVQPDIQIDYQTGSSAKSTITPVITPEPQPEIETPKTTAVYRTPKGKKYHFDPECGGKNSYETTLESAKTVGLTPCAKCAQ